MAKTIWQCVTAIICVVVISLTTMSGLNGIAEAKIAAAEKYAEAAQNAGSNVGDNAGSTDTITPDAGTDAVTPDAGTDAVTPDAGTDATTPDAGTTDAATPDAGTEATKPAADAGSKAPSSKADIVACYNSAINKVVSSKAGFKKSRETVMHNLDGGALLKIQLVVDMVNDFLGVGTESWDNKKGEQNNLSKASLTEADLTGATCADNNGIYTITLNLKNGESSAKAGSNSDTSPLQRAGVYAGKGDKKAYDYKNSENIHTAINGVDDCTAESAIEKVTNTKIVAVVDSKTGKLQSLTASWDWYVELTQVKYTIVGIKQAKGNATTTVKLTNVQW